jgi:hypothetical protein
MTLEMKAKTVFDEVRAYYSTSEFKSDNKNYDLTVVPQNLLAKRTQRNKAADGGTKVRGEQLSRANEVFSKMPPSGRSHSADMGQALWNSKTTTMNCDELAQMACYRAAEANAPANRMNLASPADHALCVIGETKSIKAIAGKKVSDLADLPASVDAYAVDVWLNIVCHIRAYPAEVSAKLEKWAQSGKRIAWFPDGENELWDMPNKVYRDTFLKATLDGDFE